MCVFVRVLIDLTIIFVVPPFVGFWPFNGTGQDYGGLGNHGALNGNVASVNGVLGQPNGALRFPGYVT